MYGPRNRFLFMRSSVHRDNYSKYLDVNYGALGFPRVARLAHSHTVPSSQYPFLNYTISPCFRDLHTHRQILKYLSDIYNTAIALHFLTKSLRRIPKEVEELHNYLLCRYCISLHIRSNFGGVRTAQLILMRNHDGNASS